MGGKKGEHTPVEEKPTRINKANQKYAIGRGRNHTWREIRECNDKSKKDCGLK